MTYTITKQQLIDMEPCGLDDRLKLFGSAESMTVREAIGAGFSVSDILWVAGQLGLKAECVRFAIGCAERVSHLNTDPRIAAAINAAKAWVENPIEENRQAARAAWAASAASAGSAAWAARAAWAAARAAAASAASAASAAWAARAAWAAARAAAAWAASAASAAWAERAAWAAARAADAVASAGYTLEAQHASLIEIFG